ncbi:MAG: hypothetical protein FWF24_03020 [Alphaproteobacteria bacterium]|nr:hypothetical protein [Alphaproteobacteria bacterium]
MKNAFKKAADFLMTPHVQAFGKGFIPNSLIMGLAGHGHVEVLTTIVIMSGITTLAGLALADGRYSPKQQKKVLACFMSGVALSPVLGLPLAYHLSTKELNAPPLKKELQLQKAAQELFAQCSSKTCSATATAGAQIVEMTENVIIMKVTAPDGSQQCYLAERRKTPIQIGKKCNLSP